jgi:hypothetical protein
MIIVYFYCRNNRFRLFYYATTSFFYCATASYRFLLIRSTQPVIQVKMQRTSIVPHGGSGSAIWLISKSRPRQPAVPQQQSITSSAYTPPLPVPNNASSEDRFLSPRTSAHHHCSVIKGQRAGRVRETKNRGKGR